MKPSLLSSTPTWRVIEKILVKRFMKNLYNINAILVNSAVKVLAGILESFHRALVITADGLVSLLPLLFGGTLAVILLT